MFTRIDYPYFSTSNKLRYCVWTLYFYWVLFAKFNFCIRQPRRTKNTKILNSLCANIRIFIYKVKLYHYGIASRREKLVKLTRIKKSIIFDIIWKKNSWKYYSSTVVPRVTWFSITWFPITWKYFVFQGDFYNVILLLY